VENQIETKRLERDRAAKRAIEERLRAAQEEAKTQAEADAKRVGDNKGQEILVIDWRAPSKSVEASASAEARAQAEQMASLVAPLVLQKISRSRSVSVRAGGNR